MDSPTSPPVVEFLAITAYSVENKTTRLPSSSRDMLSHLWLKAKVSTTNETLVDMSTTTEHW